MTSRIAIAMIAAAALGISAGANAFTSTHIPTGAAVAVQPVHMPVQQVYGPPAAIGYPEAQARPWQSGCRVDRWDPHVRYMPGQVVRRHGDLWVARRISARVWNENSPPEWTPQYWAPAVCGG